jgi:hypothetical protein
VSSLTWRHRTHDAPCIFASRTRTVITRSCPARRLRIALLYRALSMAPILSTVARGGAARAASLLLAATVCRAAAAASGAAGTYVSVLGDPGMAAAVPAVSWEGWNFCNSGVNPSNYSAGPSPRMADCLPAPGAPAGPGPFGNVVTDADNALMVGQPFPLPNFTAPGDQAGYAIVKEQYLGALCARPAAPSAPSALPWSYWTVMFKSGNMQTGAGLCAEMGAGGDAVAGSAASIDHARVGFNNLPMNQPWMVHGWTTPGQAVPYNGSGLIGYFAGTYDGDPAWTPSQLAAVQAALHNYTQAWISFRFAELAAAGASGPPPPQPTPPLLLANSSYLATAWYTNVTTGATVYYQLVVTTPTYPWLMNYLRSDDVGGGNGGYIWDGRGVMGGPVPAYATQLVARLDVLSPGTGMMYLPEISGCWKLDGSPCDGNATTDVTRYACFIVTPTVVAQCSAANQNTCPPYHIRSSDGAVVLRNDTANFPYECYYQHCLPPNAPPELEGNRCDPYSNPAQQELQQLLPCSEWAIHGFPSSPGEGWAGNASTWTLDVGALGARLYFSGTEPADLPDRASRGFAPLPPADQLPPYPGWNRSWISFEIGPEQSDPGFRLMRWETSAWDVRVMVP